MDRFYISQELKNKSIYDMPLRVTFYARVSTDSELQLNSLGNQVSYYSNYIQEHPQWTYVPGYTDEGLSGLSIAKREQFNRMIEDGKAGKFDLIITKEISRFARNTLDSIQYTRELLRAGVGVYFQNDNINTFDVDSELRLTIMSSLAQDELRKLSSRVSFGHQQSIKKGHVLGNSRIYGYRKDKCRLIIDEEEAAMVRELFELYATGNYSMKQIETIFWDKGYRNHNGKKLSHTTMSNLISNPKYKGWYCGNKVQVVDMFTKKQKFLPQDKWVMYKDDSGRVPAIVSEELWDQANAVLQRRSEDVKNRQGICNHANLLTGKLICTHCGKPYYRRDSVDRQGNKNSKWVCSGKINNGKDSCPSIHIYEREIIPLLFEVFRDTRDVSAAMIGEYERLYQALTEDGIIERKLEAAEKHLKDAEEDKRTLLPLLGRKLISEQDFTEMLDDCNTRIEKATQEIAELSSQQDSSEEFFVQMERIRKVLRDAEKDCANGTITLDFVEAFIDKIYATADGNGIMRLDVKIFTGDVCEKYLEKLKSRTGHTMKKMIEAYENGLQ